MNCTRAGVFAASVLAVAATAHASTAIWQYNGVVTNVVNNGYAGFVPPVGTPVTATVTLDMALNFIGNTGTQVNNFLSLPTGFSVTIGSDSFSSSDYGIYVQNQNFAPYAQFAAQATGSNLFWNGVQQSNTGGPILTLSSLTNNVGLVPFSAIDLTTPWDMTQTVGYVAHYGPLSGEIYFSFSSVQLIPAPATLALLAAPVLVRRRRP